MATRFREFQSNKVLSVAGERTSFKMPEHDFAKNLPRQLFEAAKALHEN